MVLRPGETPQDALTRVILHERVGHDGLKALLGAKGGKGRELWEKLKASIPPAELEAIANDPAYRQLRGDPDALAQEWFARKAESSPHLLEKPGPLRDLWNHFKGLLQNLRAPRNGSTTPQLDQQLRDLLRQARSAALRPPPQADGQADSGHDSDIQFSIPESGMSAPSLAATTASHAPAPHSGQAQDPSRGGPGEGMLPGAPKRQQKPSYTPAEAAALATEKCDRLARGLGRTLSRRKTPYVASVVVDQRTGRVYQAVNRGKGRRQPTEIDPRLDAWKKKIIEDTGSETGYCKHLITNCAEFNSVNQALLDGANAEDLVVRTVKVKESAFFEPCKNCWVWLKGLNIKVVE